MKRQEKDEMSGRVRLTLSDLGDTTLADGGLLTVETSEGEFIDELCFASETQLGQRFRRSTSVKKLDKDDLVPVLSYIEVHLADDMQIEQIATLAGMSSHHFSHRFKATMSVSPYAFVTVIRMVWAKRLFTETKLSVEEIAGQVGIANISYFRKQFRKYFGLNPSIFRRMKNEGRQLPESRLKIWTKS